MLRRQDSNDDAKVGTEVLSEEVAFGMKCER